MWTYAIVPAFEKKKKKKIQQVVKVADFGVARVHSQSGVMTAETGTYRWMAPEVEYCHNVDYFSFCIFEYITCKHGCGSLRIQ